MNLWENFLLALSGLRTSKMRSLLTMLGIIIGIGSVIAIVTVGNSLTGTITSTMADMGANQIYAFVSDKESNSNRQPTPSDLISDDMVLELEEYMGDEINSVLLYSPAGSGQAKDGRRYANVSIEGVSANYLIDTNIEILRGHDIQQREINRASNVCVVSSKFVEKMFPPNVDPLGKEVKITTTSYGMLTFTVVGIYQYEVPAFLSSFAPDEDVSTQMVIPITAAKRITGAENGYDQVSVMFPPGADSYAITAKIGQFFERYYRNSQFGVFTQNMEGMLTQMTTMLSTLSIAIAIIAAISLLVGGIGVMNIMLVSVTERTREIGTRKALGAKNSAIRIQFITESMILCLIGGVIGILMGLGLGLLGTTLLGFPASPSLPIIVIAVVFSMLIGVFFGYYPANKAAKLDPIEALRYE
ncbi:MAG: ABC transporter permease [Oscillospiraceae bacterium]